MGLTFLKPLVLLFLLFIPVIVYYYILANKKKQKEAIKFSHLAIIKKAMGKQRNLRAQTLFYFLILAIVLLIIGLADPNIPLKQTKEGVNVVLVIDDSGSMQATDYSPTRLEAAKKAAAILIKSLKPNDDVGIVIFESGAATASYLTPYKERALDKLSAINQKQGQTAIGDGLSLAIDMATSIPNKQKVVILLSDGVNNAGVISPDEAIEFAKSSKIQVYTVGLGSEQPVVLGYDFFGNPQYAELDEATLMAIAQNTGGKYFKSINSDTLDDIYRNISKDIKREKEPTSIKNWFISAAIILLLVELYLRYGRKRIIQ
jgi:Ca-activated chloride channel family protein